MLILGDFIILEEMNSRGNEILKSANTERKLKQDIIDFASSLSFKAKVKLSETDVIKLVRIRSVGDYYKNGLTMLSLGKSPVMSGVTFAIENFEYIEKINRNIPRFLNIDTEITELSPILRYCKARFNEELFDFENRAHLERIAEQLCMFIDNFTPAYELAF